MVASTRGKYKRKNVLTFRGRTVAEVMKIFIQAGLPISDAAIRRWIAGQTPSKLSQKLIEKLLPIDPPF